MKKLKHYPSVWQAAPFSMEMFAHFEKEARLRNKENSIAREKRKKENTNKVKLALGM
ncbi:MULTISPECIES: hypothetical protein [Croceitalea]|uniref:Uncharacterized protein n=1 Tax=Croceitalea vernalis TaxID=3075599 RepID=A0ABU3BFQ5_9FLAO|nr:MULTISPECIES: hypothetical protein [unclassified Croceitalea]MDT0539186.1 hypothetical protein [Croceitalea sp. P059]MDT0620980.1 hypothetical protein [Croceitalea sp. P007]